MLTMAPGRQVMKFLWEECQRIHHKELTWGLCGPQLVRRAVEFFSLQSYVQPPAVFCPIPYTEWRRTIEPGLPWVFHSETRAVHFGNEMGRRRCRDKNRPYDATAPPES